MSGERPAEPLCRVDWGGFLSYNYATPFEPALLVTQDPLQTSRASNPRQMRPSNPASQATLGSPRSIPLHRTLLGIRRAAAALLDRGGPAEVKLREVGKLAGVSHNAPYKHFADKEELLAAVAAEEQRSQSQLMRRLAASRKPIDALRALARSYAQWARNKPARFKLTFGARNIVASVHRKKTVRRLSWCSFLSLT